MRWSDRPSPSSPAFRVTQRLWRLAVEIQQTDAYSGELTSLEPRADSRTSRAPVRETGVKERAKDGWRKSGSRFKQCKVKIMAQLPWQRCALGGRNPWLLTPSRSPRAPSQDNYPPKFLSFQHSLLIPLPHTTSCIVRWFIRCFSVRAGVPVFYVTATPPVKSRNQLLQYVTAIKWCCDSCARN